MHTYIHIYLFIYSSGGLLNISLHRAWAHNLLIFLIKKIALSSVLKQIVEIWTNVLAIRKPFEALHPVAWERFGLHVLDILRSQGILLKASFVIIWEHLFWPTPVPRCLKFGRISITKCWTASLLGTLVSRRRNHNIFNLWTLIGRKLFIWNGQPFSRWHLQLLIYCVV